MNTMSFLQLVKSRLMLCKAVLAIGSCVVLGGWGGGVIFTIQLKFMVLKPLV